mgnify:CR=1 FL=1
MGATPCTPTRIPRCRTPGRQSACDRLLTDQPRSRVIPLGDDAREILEAAALLCNVGMFLSHAQHHKHSYYVIRGTDRLAGFNDHEVERIALVARYHRRASPKPAQTGAEGAPRGLRLPLPCVCWPFRNSRM